VAFSADTAIFMCLTPRLFGLLPAEDSRGRCGPDGRMGYAQSAKSGRA
jgi:hypothetical protein